MVKRKIHPEAGAEKKHRKNTGGVTGSHAVKIGPDTYQEKKSLRGKGFFHHRNIKARYTDRENLGEVIASGYARAYLGALGAHVETYYDPDNQHVEVISKYLENTKHTFDQYYTSKEGLNKKLGQRRHVQLVLTNTPNANPPDGEWYITPDSTLGQTLADTLAVAAIIGDHDVNPGNRMVVSAPNQPLQAGSIDFGHALNDLIHETEALGGGVHLKEHPIFDFFNRSSVADAQLGGSISKVWRDYKGFIPSEALGEALIRMGNNREARSAGLEYAKHEFQELFEMIDQNKADTTSPQYVLKSFNQIHHAITGAFFQSNLSDNDKKKTFFTAVDSFIDNNAKDAVLAGNMMILQAQLTQALHEDIDDLQAFVKQWREKFQAKTLMNAEGELLCPWFKTNVTTPPFQGTFEAYVINERENYLEEKQATVLAQAKPEMSIVQSLVIQMQQLIHFITAYFNAMLHPKGRGEAALKPHQIGVEDIQNETQQKPPTVV
ncbi:MAG: hypothetical protein P1U32_06035 [Legionellaceae bacterium]|nr:hypothetical protein [Legionellaceae bacterium]